MTGSLGIPAFKEWAKKTEDKGLDNLKEKHEQGVPKSSKSRKFRE